MPFAKPTSTRHGAALIIVLSVLFLVTALVVAFFNTMRMETRGNANYEQLARLQQLQTLPLEIVKAQIHTATTHGQTGAPHQVTHLWASQPGAIRVFNATGGLARLYKLYSATSLEADEMAFLANAIPNDWHTRPNAYVDLNEPFLALSPIAGSDPALRYPILDPDAALWAEGLTLHTDPAGQENGTMPVEWLYVLEDGSLVPHAELTNRPAIARVAFWTDDETAKVNINTAGERTFWDRPRTAHHLSYEMAYHQPSSGEYNAYPGHPATVSLSAVLGRGLPNTLNATQRVEKMLTLSPRYAWGGSENATRPTFPVAGQPDRVLLDRTRPNALTKDDRLYATEMELLFNPLRNIIDPQLQEPILKSGFLLTGSSRSPELNLFGTPRISLWPTDTDTDKQTVYDRLLNQVATIGNQHFYFQRENQFATDEATSIPRNWALLQHLDTLTSLPQPGFGGSFATKYTTQGNRQILTEMFDYLRAGVNLNDTSRDLADFPKQFAPALSSHPGYVLPTRIPQSGWDTRGAGRVPIINNIGLVLYAYHQRGYTHQGIPPDTLPPSAQTDVHCFIAFNFISPMLGVAPFKTTYRIEILRSSFGLRSAIPGQTPQYFALRGTSNNRFHFTDQGKDWGGYEAIIGLGSGQSQPGGPFQNGYEFHSTTPITITGDRMDFYGGELELAIYDNQTGTLLQTYTVEFPSSNTTSPWKVPLAWQQTDLDAIPVTDNQNNPIPGAGYQSRATYFWERNPLYAPFQDSDQVNGTSTREAYSLGSRRHNANSRSLDVIRGVELKHGDARLLAYSDTIPKTWFQPSLNYLNGDRRIACSLLFIRNVSNINRLLGGQGDSPEFGKAVNVNYHGSTQHWYYLTMLNQPPLPAHHEGTPFTSLRQLGWAGDIDRGMLGEPDGPFLNKPDEGFISTINPATAQAGTQFPYLRSMGVNISGIPIKSWDPRASGFFSPMRQIPSAIQFGSLPSGIAQNAPWQTLAFSPNSQATITGTSGHPGEAPPHDHLYLDYFTMPVVEPYAISEPLSIAGRVNLNQRLIPFTHIQRETGLHAVFKSMKFIANTSEPTRQNEINWYTTPESYGPAPSRWHLTSSLDVAATLAEIRKTLDPASHPGSGAFRTASEITKIFLIPEGLGSETPQAFWARHQLTGDNTREAPYNYLYPLLTTQSNTYQIHYRIQTLTPLRRRLNFNPQSDFTISGERRGSYLIERYLDVNDPRFQLTGGGTLDATSQSLHQYYQFRILRHAHFSPGQ